MKKLIKVLFLMLCIMLLTSMIYAKGNNETAESDVTSGTFENPADYSGKLIIWAWSESEIEALTEKFNEVYPNVEVVFVPVGSGEYLAKLQATLVSNSELPDVAFMEIGSRGKLMDLDCWENLSGEPYNLDRDLFFESLLPTMTNSRGEIVGIERELNPSGMAFKRDLSKKWLGTDDPDEIAKMFPDWDSFIKKGREVYEKSGGKVRFMAGLDDASRILIRQYGKSIFDGDKVYASEFFNSRFSILTSVRDNNIAGKLITYSPSWNASFSDSAHIFYPCAPWSAQWIIKPNAPEGSGNWAVTKAPGGSYCYGGTAYAIPKNAKHKNLAWEFIRWQTTSTEGAMTAINSIGAITSLKSIYADGIIPNNDPFFGGQDVNKYLIEKIAPEMKIRALSPYDPVLTDIVNLIFGILNNDLSIDAEAAVELAMKELKFKLPASFTIE